MLRLRRAFYDTFFEYFGEFSFRISFQYSSLTIQLREMGLISFVSQSMSDYEQKRQSIVKMMISTIIFFLLTL